MKPEDLLKEGKLNEALKALMDQVRSSPSDALLRVFLFQLLALMGQWERALNQLKVSGELDRLNDLLVGVYVHALHGELQRHVVFSGLQTPLVIGEPTQWMAWLFEALKTQIGGRCEQAMALRLEAFDQAEALSGSIDGVPFDWIADGDTRFGPCLEIILNKGYYWVPFSRIREIKFETPSDLRDKVWAAVEVTWDNGGQVIGFIPSRYPGSECSEDHEIVLARKTEWQDIGNDCFVGFGQRMLATNAGDYPLLDIRSITFNLD
ncbi:type VI secretion system accessory protein TagJ [Acidithiobacillus ferrivorans]|uniref:Virulence protein SciE type n=1 Tax=Acidithiobacillus ferrivorans TaxID=160808 RepID=A0A7T4WFG6_9PROT|nr:type VI secretion system accessory protein TagJ [Acidithiobacillus ferrivorans]QQD73639.1 virulence protein SciE type [Acidithiobacillus ferrivorans]